MEPMSAMEQVRAVAAAALPLTQQNGAAAPQNGAAAPVEDPALDPDQRAAL